MSSTLEGALLQRLGDARDDQSIEARIARLKARWAAEYPAVGYDRTDGFAEPDLSTDFSEPAERPQRTRKPPRLDPVKSALRMLAKYPSLSARFAPDGSFEIASKAAAPDDQPAHDAPNEWDAKYGPH